ncbi:hypothetical protein ABZP36_009081 [Zizania latifolia]
MKHSSKRYLASVCDADAQCSPTHGCDHQPALREIARGQCLVTQLRAIVLPALQADERGDLAAQMLEGILDCSRKAMSELQLLLSCEAPDEDHAVDDKSRVRKISSSDHDGCSSKAAENKNAKPLRQHKRRSYYRCTYRQEEKCKATKTVQQREDRYAGSNGDHSVMYTVVYYGQHTCCKGPAGHDHVVVEASQISTESPSPSQSQSQSSSSDAPPPAANGDNSIQCNNVSVTCSSVVTEDGQASMDSNKLLDMLPAADDDLTTDVLFDMAAAYAPLDLDISWEMDADTLWL